VTLSNWANAWSVRAGAIANASVAATPATIRKVVFVIINPIEMTDILKNYLKQIFLYQNDWIR
jgi:hypothetical protein